MIYTMLMLPVVLMQTMTVLTMHLKPATHWIQTVTAFLMQKKQTPMAMAYQTQSKVTLIPMVMVSLTTSTQTLITTASLTV